MATSSLSLLAEVASSRLSSLPLTSKPVDTNANNTEKHSPSLICGHSTLKEERLALKERAIQICLSKHAMDRRENPRPRSLAFFMENVNNTVLRNKRHIHKILLTQNDLMTEYHRRYHKRNKTEIVQLPPSLTNDHYTKSSFMYFQNMRDGTNHGLDKHLPVAKKEYSHLPYSQLPLIKEELIILPPVDGRMIYIKKDLQKTPHGGELVSNLPKIMTKLRQHGIECTVIGSASYSYAGIVDLRGKWGYVGFSNSYSALQKIRKQTSKMECKLVQFLLEQQSLHEDLARGEKAATGSVNSRLSWGFIRAQPRSRESFRELDGKSIPCYRLHDFKRIPSKCKDFLMMIAEISCVEARRYHGNSALAHPVRTSFAKAMHAEIGYPHTTASFEYYDIVITSSDNHTKRHMDYMNDYRDDYNISCVYTFFNIFKRVEYKVSFIMTTRVVIGNAIESHYKKHTHRLLEKLGSVDTLEESETIYRALMP